LKAARKDLPASFCFSWKNLRRKSGKGAGLKLFRRGPLLTAVDETVDFSGETGDPRYSPTNKHNHPSLKNPQTRRT
jgi:hypothetical protein